MDLGGHRKRSIIAVGTLGVVLVALAVALNIGWILANWRSGLLLVFGVLCFSVLIAGLTLNTLFLIKEIRLNEQHDAFINAVTHELKTPVASIRLYLQTLQQREVPPRKRVEFIDVMLQDSERLQGTIDQVLLAGKSGAARRRLNRTDVDVGEMVRECLKLASKRHNLPDRELELRETPPAGVDALVSGDPDELKAAVANLLDNAVKYSGETVNVVVEVARFGTRKVVIHVRDQGIGITKDELKRVFRRFYRIPGRFHSKVKGTGLGLSIVRAVAQRHGGRAYVASPGPGLGSTFSLELPLKST